MYGYRVSNVRLSELVLWRSCYPSYQTILYLKGYRSVLTHIIVPILQVTLQT